MPTFKKDAVSWFSSDDQYFTAEIFHTGDTFGIDFFEGYGNDYIGTVMYPGRSEAYLESAAENFVQGILRSDDIKLISYTDEIQRMTP